MRNFLITGALGFIASNFVNYMSLKYPHAKFIILDKKDYCSSVENINKQSLHNTEIIIGDIGNKELVLYILEKFEIDTILHFAAQSHVDNSFFNSIDFTINNVLGTHLLLETCRIYNNKTNKIEKFVHVSTDEVYGQVTDNEARIESSVLDPTNPYAASKAAAEFFAKSYYYSYKFPIIVTRGNNVYGPNQYPEKVIPKFICKLLDGEKLTIQGNGSSLRNFIHVDDVNTAFETILLKGEIGHIYNISSDHANEYSIKELAKILINLFNPDINIDNDEELNKHLEYVEDRKFNDARYFISSDKLYKLGWKPQKTDFIANLKDLIEWYKQNRNRYN
ncbi:dTDP-D-glucose 46-dehydratase [Fadolivirus algeromassiliense]|jgi:dTDP-glucose 4,6-dehydratase|uniref:dTDP-D-glucose 46-dehydratase n=1 Tax=Fadolivirus FV1/VV64 TaxID=3070911 RepID=A0A7D3QTR9_9VIRU|nr:dTDP-D-glucose 46-dehydratase [Fadolivirus algeromassiliense]QKF93547.1 dTDP-D-glucose 46-dehydratase [Fadolivirus FV1/VV64]